MRETPKFTPGPWIWDGPADNIHITLAADANMRVCFLTSNGPTEANAHLIAAAPELYEALKAALRFIDASMDADPARFLINQIECALAKAVGKKAALAYRPEDQAEGRT